MSSIFTQAKLISLVLAQDSLVRLADNETDPDTVDAINDAIKAVDKVIEYYGYGSSTPVSPPPQTNTTV